MLRRSERISNNSLSISSIDKLKHFTALFQSDNQKNRTKKQRIRNINLMYNLIYNEFYDIRYDIHKLSPKKEEFFIKLIKTIKNRENVLLDELEQPDIKYIKYIKLENSLKRNIIKTGNKIKKYIEIYNAEQKEAFIRLSSKIGIDLVKNIKSFL
jgi:uncharacterized protein YjcR